MKDKFSLTKYKLCNFFSTIKMKASIYPSLRSDDTSQYVTYRNYLDANPEYIFSVNPDVSGCDSSGNILDINSNPWPPNLNPCVGDENFFQYDCEKDTCNGTLLFWAMLLIPSSIFLFLLFTGIAVWIYEKYVSNK